MQMTDDYGNFMGETMLPEVDGALSFHKGRYEFALTKISGGKVLDMGCGIGYGSVVLLGKCSEYVGFDYHPSRKLRADAEFSNPKSTFITHSANEPFPFEDNSFDNAVCFEAIEHIEKDYFAISEIYRVLKSGGVFVASTPMKRGEKGRYHIREYTVEEFKALISSKFSKVDYYGQPYSSDFKLDDFKQIYILCVAVKE
jgi:ubiquinone/menaquinone biosynthesis C-methylase UbiE